MSTARSLVLLALALLTLPACDSAEEYMIGGTYSGVTEDTSFDVTTLDLVVPPTSSGDTFSFSATVTETDPRDGTVFGTTRFAGTGTYTHPTLSITVQDETNTGTVSEDGNSIRLEIEEGEFATLTRATLTR